MKSQLPTELQPTSGGTPVGRAVRVIELMALEKGRPCSVESLSERMGLPLSAVRRVVRSLIELDLIESSDEFSYSFAPRMLGLSGLINSAAPLEKFARPIMRELVARFDETSTLNAYLHVERRSICVAVEECQKPMQYSLEIGEMKFLHSGAAGKAILAFLPESTINDVINRHSLPAITSKTTTDRATLIRELDRIKKEGVVVTRSERIEGSVGVAAPVLNAAGQVIASLCLTTPSLRISEAMIENARYAVRYHAQELSKRLGYDPEHEMPEPAYASRRAKS